MTDFETRLRETLHERADTYPGAPDLAAGARGRLRRRRTTIAGAGVLAGALIVAPFLFNHGEPQSRDVATDPTSPTAIEAPADAIRGDGLRAESWHDVTFEVPDDWGHGAPTGQCFSSASIPSVGRPGDPAPSVDCAGPGYGATVAVSDPASYFAASGDVFRYSDEGVEEPLHPGDAWVGTWYDDEVVVTIATPDKALTEQIVASVRVIEGVDDNGCAPMLGDAEAGSSDGTGSMSVCRYDGSDQLEWSRRLSDAGRAALGDAIEAAPVRTVEYDCPFEDEHSRTAVLDDGAYLATVVTDALSCEGWNGIFLSGLVREVTDEVREALERPGPAG